MKRKAEQFLSPLNPKSVVWDFDETLAAIRPAAIFLKTIQHALTEDPFAKKLLPEVKLSLLQDVASTIVQKGIFRPGMNKFFQLLERLKRMGFVKNVYIFTAASPPKEKALLSTPYIPSTFAPRGYVVLRHKNKGTHKINQGLSLQ